jgi:hypothetical protein
MVFLGIPHMLCEENIGEIQPSPNTRYEARVMESSCGVGTDYVGKIEVRKNIGPISIPFITKHTIFSFQGRTSGAELEWLDDSNLSIIVRDCSVVAEKSRDWNDIQLHFAYQCY